MREKWENSYWEWGRNESKGENGQKSRTLQLIHGQKNDLLLHQNLQKALRPLHLHLHHQYKVCPPLLLKTWLTFTSFRELFDSCNPKKKKPKKSHRRTNRNTPKREFKHKTEKQKKKHFFFVSFLFLLFLFLFWVVFIYFFFVCFFFLLFFFQNPKEH